MSGTVARAAPASRLIKLKAAIQALEARMAFAELVFGCTGQLVMESARARSFYVRRYWSRRYSSLCQ